jgi:hypothetical protein
MLSIVFFVVLIVYALFSASIDLDQPSYLLFSRFFGWGLQLAVQVIMMAAVGHARSSASIGLRQPAAQYTVAPATVHPLHDNNKRLPNAPSQIQTSARRYADHSLVIATSDIGSATAAGGHDMSGRSTNHQHTASVGAALTTTTAMSGFTMLPNNNNSGGISPQPRLGSPSAVSSSRTGPAFTTSRLETTSPVPSPALTLSSLPLHTPNNNGRRTPVQRFATRQLRSHSSGGGGGSEPLLVDVRSSSPVASSGSRDLLSPLSNGSVALSVLTPMGAAQSIAAALSVPATSPLSNNNNLNLNHTLPNMSPKQSAMIPSPRLVMTTIGSSSSISRDSPIPIPTLTLTHRTQSTPTTTTTTTTTTTGTTTASPTTNGSATTLPTSSSMPGPRPLRANFT